MTAPEWTPATPGEYIAYTIGYLAGDTAGEHRGRALGAQSGQEAATADILIALKLGLSDVDQNDTDAVHRVLVTPIGDLMAQHIRWTEQYARRREWDAAANLPRPTDRRPARRERRAA